jgi:hypothetical protein
MARMTNQQLIARFVDGFADGKDQSHTGNLWVSPNGDKLVNYATCLIQVVNGVIIFNETKYSASTSKIQSYIRREIGLTRSFISLKGVPFDTRDLYDWYKSQPSLHEQEGAMQL